MQRLRPDDQFLLLVESDATPMHIGALLYFDVPPSQRLMLFERLRSHFVDRLPHTPLLRVLRHCPLLYDSPVWLDIGGYDIDAHILRVPGCAAMDERGVRAFVARCSLERLDLAQPPFCIHIFDQLADGRAAVLLKVHHALTDGVGFQTILGLLSDDSDAPARPPAPKRTTERPPAAPFWLAASALRFLRERDLRLQAAAQRRNADSQLKDMQAATPRAKTPVLNLSAPVSKRRCYATLSLSLPAMRAMAARLGGTINDLFLAIAATALRHYLLEIGDLPALPLVANSARSYRLPKHGDFGNRIVALHPQLATHIADPVRRLHAIQQSMAAEKTRSVHDEAMLDQPEAPFGPHKRRKKFAQRMSAGTAVLPGNVTLSNVPGPTGSRFFAGCRQVANFPTPLLGSGRFLNITSRRNGDRLDLGLIADPDKLADIDRLVSLLHAAFEEYMALSPDVLPQAAAPA
jgi:diacylglycerol O-acyltransferase